MPDPLLSRGVLRRLALTLALTLAVVVTALTPRAAHAWGRSGPPGPSLYAPSWQDGAPVIVGRTAWQTGGALARSGSDLVAEAARYVGSGKFTELPGAWCADAVSFWLQATGRAPLANRMAASALVYGPHIANPRPGDLVVMRTNRGWAHHVGIVSRVETDGTAWMISGNYGRHVAEARVPRSGVAFIAVR
jgi:uncharacterized protein (TIGR02594 family)